MDKVFQHLHAAHESLARAVGRRHPSLAGLDPPDPGKDPPESGVLLQAAILRYDILAACTPTAYQTNAAMHGIHSEAALRLMEVLQNASPGFHCTTQNQLQEELERQANTLEEDIRHLHALLAADRKHAIKDFWRRNAQDIVQRWEAVRGAIEVEAPVASGLWNMKVPNIQTLLIEAHGVIGAVRAFWQVLYGKRPVDVPNFQAVLCRHMLQVPD